LREWTTTDCRNTPSTTNPEDEEIVDASGKKATLRCRNSVKRRNPWMMMMMMIMMMIMNAYSVNIDEPHMLRLYLLKDERLLNKFETK